MAWAKVDDKLWGCDKWLSAPPTARALWVTGLSYCMDQLTDGLVKRHTLPLLGGSPDDADALVAAGLWEVDDAGWRFHDWSDYQPSRADVLEKRAAETARKAEWRSRRKAKPVPALSPDSPTGTDIVTDTGIDSGSPALPVPDPYPTRPDPKNKVLKSVGASGTRIPDDFAPNDAMLSWAVSEGMTQRDVTYATSQFADYWRSASTRTAVKKDWPAAWRNWVRRDIHDRAPQNGHRKPGDGRPEGW